MYVYVFCAETEKGICHGHIKANFDNVEEAGKLLEYLFLESGHESVTNISLYKFDDSNFKVFGVKAY